MKTYLRSILIYLQYSKGKQENFIHGNVTIWKVSHLQMRFRHLAMPPCVAVVCDEGLEAIFKFFPKIIEQRSTKSQSIKTAERDLKSWTV